MKTIEKTEINVNDIEVYATNGDAAQVDSGEISTLEEVEELLGNCDFVNVYTAADDEYEELAARLSFRDWKPAQVYLTVGSEPMIFATELAPYRPC